MKSRILPLSFPLFLFFTAPSASLAYIGNPSFSLDDDYDYRGLREEMNQAKLRAERTDHRAREVAQGLHQDRTTLAEKQKRLSQLPAEIARLEQNAQALQTKVNNLQAETPKLQQALNQAQLMLKQAQDSIAGKKAELAEAEKSLKSLQDQCKTQPSEDCTSQVNAAKLVVTNIKGALVGLESQQAGTQTIIRELNSKIQNNNKQVLESQNQIAKDNQAKQELSRALNDLKQSVPALELKVQNLSGELNHIEAEVRRTSEQARRAIADFERFSRDLEVDIDRYNNAGAVKGEDDARRDGYEMAQSMGSSVGIQDGRADGLNDGTSAGRQRDYSNGQNLGLSDGKRDGISNGTQDGKKQGTVKALTDLGAKEGSATGIDQAQKSDAVQVGTNQGVAAGLSRATATGKVNGVKLANEEGLKKHESGSLKKIEVNGPFSGLFARSVPHLPSHFRGRNYLPTPGYGREILRKAFLDGYEAMYDYNVVAEFEHNVGSIYNSSYDSSYHASYDSAVSQTYRDSYDGGYKNGYDAVYGNQYEQSRKAQYAISYKDTTSNPNREDSVYTNSFESNRKASYADKYEEIRSKIFGTVEAETFNKNIQQKTAESKQRRSVEVDDLFAKHPVLAFVSSEVNDGGVKGITKTDGIFQPGETVVHSLTIKNFGSQDMSDATIVSSTGQSQKLPVIPAKSELTIKGAVVSTIDPKTPEKYMHTSVIRVKAPLTSQDSLQAVHYSKAADSLLVDAESKQVKVLYPIYVSGIQNNFSSLKVNQVQNLKLSLMNFSDVIYNDIDVEMTSNASTDIFISKFDKLPEINSGLEISDSNIMPELVDLGKTIEIRGALKYKGVTLGVLEKPILFKVTK